MAGIYSCHCVNPDSRVEKTSEIKIFVECKYFIVGFFAYFIYLFICQHFIFSYLEKKKQKLIGLYYYYYYYLLLLVVI